MSHLDGAGASPFGITDGEIMALVFRGVAVKGQYTRFTAT